MVKSLCVRFNLDNEADRKAWETVHSGNKSANRMIIDAINNSGNDSVAETVRSVLNDFFSGKQVSIPAPEKKQEKELDLNEIDFDFLGG
jgi:hypothetical protein